MNMNEIIGRDDLLLLTFDTLRYDVAQRAWKMGRTPHLSQLLPNDGWEERHSPGNFTYAAHAAFFTGFFPTPLKPGRHERLLALNFPGSETITKNTCVMNASDIVTGLAEHGYHTICIGGVGFFNQLTPLGNQFPSLFAESYWSQDLGVTCPESTENQFRLASAVLEKVAPDRRVFLFINLSALHQPNKFYLPGSLDDNCETQQAALEYVDRNLTILFAALRNRGSGFGIFCSDHGTAYGEDGYFGHRLAHPVVWNVPYAEISWKRETGRAAQ